MESLLLQLPLLESNHMKRLDGSELAGYIKERQAKQVRGLRQAHHILPCMAIIQVLDTPVINSYVKLKRRYATDIGAELQSYIISQADAPALIERLNNDPLVHGIIVQFPIEDMSQGDFLVNLVAPEKDVDALGEHALFDPATPLAVHWLLSGYNVELHGKRVVIIGRGRLVGRPLERMWRQSGIAVTVLDAQTPELEFLQTVKNADVIVSATGSPGVLKSDMIKPGAVVVDAGVATEKGKLVGDAAPELLERDDITITPKKGGVGPLTVCAIFDNTLRAARLAAGLGV